MTNQRDVQGPRTRYQFRRFHSARSRSLKNTRRSTSSGRGRRPGSDDPRSVAAAILVLAPPRRSRSYPRRHPREWPAARRGAVHWKSGTRLLPDFAARCASGLRLGIRGCTSTAVTRYRLPAGYCFDRVVGKRLARASLQELADRVAAYLTARESKWRHTCRSWRSVLAGEQVHGFFLSSGYRKTDAVDSPAQPQRRAPTQPQTHPRPPGRSYSRSATA